MKDKVTIVLSITAIVLSTISIILSIVTKAGIDNQLKVLSKEEILKDYVDVTIGQLTIVEGSYSDKVNLPVKVTNKSKKAISISLEINALDSVGNIITHASKFSSSLEAGQSETFSFFTYETSETIPKLKTATFEIGSINVFQ